MKILPQRAFQAESGMHKMRAFTGHAQHRNSARLWRDVMLPAQTDWELLLYVLSELGVIE